MSAELKALVDQLWQPHPEGPVRVSMGPVPADDRLVEQYAVLPSPHKARFLLPIGSRSVEVAAFRKFNAAKAPVMRAARASLAAVFASGMGARVFSHRLSVSIDGRVPEQSHKDWLVLSHLASALGRDDLVACLSVRRLRPNVKPTLQLFTTHGVPVGYTKLGWSAATRAMAGAEARALLALDGGSGVLVTPKLLTSGDWRHYTYCVISPLPEELRRWKVEPSLAPEISREVLSSGGVQRSRLSGSPYSKRLRAELDMSAADEPAVAQILRDWLTRLEAHETELEFGRWHGDWVPWNLGKVGTSVAAWDWEHSEVQTPAGFDLLHWHFQQEMGKNGFDAAVRKVDEVTDSLGVLGVPRPGRPVVASLYLLEMFVRTTRLSIGGGGWNPKYHPMMLTVADSRDR